MDSPIGEMEEENDFVLVPDAADLRSYHGFRDQDGGAHGARVLDGSNEKTIDLNYFASPASKAKGKGETPAILLSGVESKASVDDDREAEDEVGVAEDKECEDGEGDHGWQRHAVGALCSVGLAAAATGLALLLGGNGKQEAPLKVHFRVPVGHCKPTKVSVKRDARIDQGISVRRAPAVISFRGYDHGQRF